MSMKRTKSSGAKRGPSNREMAHSPLFSPKKDDAPKFTWKEHVGGATEDAFSGYALATKYDRGTLLEHPKFGRGIVTLVEGKRIDVLFEDGAKKLAHDTQPD
jgi:hypothetical protein